MQNIVIVHIKLYRSNCFLIISDNSGKILFTKSSGCLGFQNMQKRSIEAFNSLLSTTIKLLLSYHNCLVFLKLDGINKKNLDEIYVQVLKILKKYKINIIGFKIIHKIPHNGCRKKLR